MKKLLISLSFVLFVGTAFAEGQLPKFESQDPTVTNGRNVKALYIPKGFIGFFDGQNKIRFINSNIREQSHVKFGLLRYNKYFAQLASRLSSRYRLYPNRRGRRAF